MKRIGIFGAVLLAAGALWADDPAPQDAPTITLHRVQQRYPWNNKVDIDYTVANVPADSVTNYYVRFQLADNGVTNVLHSMLDASTLVDASNGTYRVTWDRDGEGDGYPVFTKTASLWAELVYCDDGDKSNMPYGDQYMIIDLTAGASATTYPVSYAYLPFAMATNRFNTTEYKTNKLVLRGIKAGSFTMGSPASESGRQLNDQCMCKETQHPVTLTQNFLLGMFEVTLAQYARVMGGTSSADSPICSVSYSTIRGASTGCSVPPDFGQVDGDSFMGKLSARTRLSFDLPTEAQWEYACRASTTTTTYAANGQALNDIAWCGGGSTHPVGLKAPNAWGLYDMIGNVWEICRDRCQTPPNDNFGYASGELNIPEQVDPQSETSAGRTCARGGGYRSSAAYCRAACRVMDVVVTGYMNDRGFRVSRTIPKE